MRSILFATGLMMAAASTATAGPIEAACNASARSKGDRELCQCIQQAADRTLGRPEQRRAARFFKNPDEAQQVRMSKSDADNEFWAKYRNFVEMAEAFCAR